MGVEHWDKQRALALPRRLYMGSIIVEHLAIAIQPPDRYTTRCTLIGRKSVTTTRHACAACMRCLPPKSERSYLALARRQTAYALEYFC